VAQAKIVYGGISKSNLSILKDPTAFSTLSKKPYVELGAGVENIFKLIRVDFIWRMAYLDHPDISKFGIRASLQLLF
jgi:hypothetical protein